MYFSQTKFKISAFILFILLLCPIQASASMMSNISAFYTHLTNPAAWFFDSPAFIPKFPFAASGVQVKASQEFSLPFKTLSNNFLLTLISFGNEKSINNLNLAKGLGTTAFQYYVIGHPSQNHWEYMASNMDAPSVLLYGYTWFINIPAKIFAQIGAISAGTDEFYYSGVEIFYIDTVFNIISLVIEIPVAMVNTCIGAVIAFIFHPIDSICGILPAIYFFIYSTLAAIWELIVQFFGMFF